MKLFKTTILLIALTCACQSSISQEGANQFYEKVETNPGEKSVFPDEKWSYSPPESFGYSSKGLLEVKAYFEDIGGDAMIVIKNGYVIASYGDVEVPIPNYSIRKSFLNCLLGIEYDRGNLDLNATMQSLGVDDNEGLSSLEKKATIEHLLKASSGIYHPANHESREQKKERPSRGSKQPGESFYYNNWDFNALGAIYAKLSGVDLFDAYKTNIAEKLGMQDFSMKNTEYVNGSSSKYPAYLFESSARDDARFGLLYLNKGRWENETIVSQEWVEKSLTLQATTGESRYYDYGYLWWIDTKNNMYIARGNSGQYIAIIPHENMVIVFRADPGSIINDWMGNRVKPWESFSIIPKVLAAKK